MLATSPMPNSLFCNLSANFTIIDGNFQHSSLSIQPCPIPPDHHRLRSVVLSGCSSSRSSFSLRKASFVSQAVTWLAEEDQGLEEEEEEEEKKKKKKKNYLAIFLQSHVKVLCKKSPPDYLCPRQREPKNTTSSGFIVRGRKVLTCAHSVDNHTKVQLKKPNSDTLYIATVLSVALECDLALLTVNDDKFWEGVMPVDFGGMPAVQDKLAVLGYPNGKFSMTKTRVSRVSMVKFQWSQTELLGVKVDVAIEDGVSGAPVLSKSGKCVGMAFQSCKEDESDIIAVPVICHFLEDYFRNGVYTGMYACVCVYITPFDLLF
ncbi:hypothetical protein RHSIM_Rhsim13G0041000 [Rhododendron simsii]|uniref:Uncharacterized protein n=1 Tax=Rhododendron simsii TaxID=118357 RepID=A0A834L447_RHOSS|nr:hypothetical protein RHSIM_Rhsim13G0041000 [Rhododendron simsii]